MKNPVLMRFKKNKLAMFGVYLMMFMFIFVLLAPVISSYEAVIKMNADARFCPPGALHILGTDEFGRELLARVLYGGRISLISSFCVIIFGFLFGAVIGSIAGYVGGKTDMILMRCMDVLMSVPSTLLAMAIITALGNGIKELIERFPSASEQYRNGVKVPELTPEKQRENIEKLRKKRIF